MHRSRNLGHDKKGPNFNHAHGRSHTALWHRRARSRSIVLSVGILVQAMPTAAELRILRGEHVKTLRTAAETAGVLVVPERPHMGERCRTLADPRQKSDENSTAP